jgi:hypothetical protein
MRVSDNALRKLIKGTFLATLLLAAMEGGKPLNEATWILVGAVLPRPLTSRRVCKAAGRHVTDSSKPLPGQRFRSRTLYVEGHDSRVSSPTSGTPLLPILMS